jgi:HD-GYP domain-containing protein (c-di-GMP phosphodiesterase class II)
MIPSPVNIGDLVLAISRALDLASPELYNHATRVAAIAYEFGRELDFHGATLKKILFAALLHDCGISSSEMKLLASDFDTGIDAEQHCMDGSELLRNCEMLPTISPIVRNHHIHWETIPLARHTFDSTEMLGNLLHLADRTEICIDRHQHALLQKDAIEQRILEKSGTVFSPDLVRLFLRQSEKESFWLGIESGQLARDIWKLAREHVVSATLVQLKKLSSVFASIIDRKSPFTYRHSHGVAGTAVELAEHMGLPPVETLKIEIAGFLHDLGKLSVPDTVLEKPDKLTAGEWQVMKQHSYYTHLLLSGIESLEDIARWAALHHEKLNGSGYPFGLTAPRLPLGARIVAVSDIYQSLREERPYRAPKSWSQAQSILDNMVRNHEIDGRVVEALKRIKARRNYPICAS